MQKIYRDTSSYQIIFGFTTPFYNGRFNQLFYLRNCILNSN